MSSFDPHRHFQDLARFVLNYNSNPVIFGNNARILIVQLHDSSYSYIEFGYGNRWSLMRSYYVLPSGEKILNACDYGFRPTAQEISNIFNHHMHMFFMEYQRCLGYPDVEHAGQIILNATVRQINITSGRKRPLERDDLEMKKISKPNCLE